MDSNKVSNKDLKKLEDEAYFELRQIIAEAMQLQDVELLNIRISQWKSKYKKLLDASSSNSNFKKRIEFLLNQYYSEVTQYIWRQIKFKKEKKIENQSKALAKLYRIIKETNDINLLKEKVKEWKSKYPISSFLNMYKKKIELAITDKNLKRNAFDQNQAFYDLIQITKINGTFDELKSSVSDWENKYSIHDMYELDDFIKNQSTVKRYTSDDYLRSISNQKFDQDGNEIINNYNAHSQAKAYKSLLIIMKKRNNTNQVFDWVYKYNSIKFDDKYKELILAATYLDYSPTYLNYLSIPEIDLSNSSLSINEYNNINEIKRYAIISYFNLLLPLGKAVPNNYFNKYIKEIYSKSERLKHGSTPNTSIDEIISSGIEIPLINNNSFESSKLNNTKHTIKELASSEIKSREPVQEVTASEVEFEEHIQEITDTELKSIDSTQEITTSKAKSEEHIQEISSTELDSIDSTQEVTVSQSLPKPCLHNENSNSDQSLEYNTIVTLSPMFFEVINNYSVQANLITEIDRTTTKYSKTINSIKTIEPNVSKTKNKLE